VSFKPNEPRALKFFHIRIAKQKINQEKLKWKNWTRSSERLNDKLNGISKQDKQAKGKAIKDDTQKRT